MSTCTNVLRLACRAMLVCVALGLYLPRVRADEAADQPPEPTTNRNFHSDVALVLRAFPLWTFHETNNAGFVAPGLRINGLDLMIVLGEVNANLRSPEARLGLGQGGKMSELSGLAVGLRLGWTSDPNECFWYGLGVHGARVGLWDTTINSDIGGYTMGALAEVGIRSKPTPYFPTAGLGVALGVTTSIYNAEAGSYGEVGLHETTTRFVMSLFVEVAYEIYRLTSAHRQPTAAR